MNKPLTIEQAQRVINAFGPNSALYETTNATDFADLVNRSSRDQYGREGFCGNLAHAVEIELRVNSIMCGFCWDDARSDEDNEKAKAEYYQWKEEMGERVNKVVKEILAENV